MLLIAALAALAGALAVPAGAAAPGGLAARPKPPLSSELREATPEPHGSVGARSDLGEPTRLPNGATEILPPTGWSRSTALRR